MHSPETTLTGKRAEYTERVKQQLDSLNAKVDEIEAKLQHAKAEVRSSYRAELAKLRLQAEQASDKLDQLNAVGEVAWDKTVQEMDRVRDAFVHSLNYFKSQF
jgi:chromosome segregation ATPase